MMGVDEACYSVGRGRWEEMTDTAGRSSFIICFGGEVRAVTVAGELPASARATEGLSTEFA